MTAHCSNLRATFAVIARHSLGVAMHASPMCALFNIQHHPDQGPGISLGGLGVTAGCGGLGITFAVIAGLPTAFLTAILMFTAGCTETSAGATEKPATMLGCAEPPMLISVGLMFRAAGAQTLLRKLFAHFQLVMFMAAWLTSITGADRPSGGVLYGNPQGDTTLSKQAAGLPAIAHCIWQPLWYGCQDQASKAWRTYGN